MAQKRVPLRHTLGLLAGAAAALALGALALSLAAPIGTRIGLWHFRSGFSILRLGGYIGIAAILAGTVAGFLSLRGRLWRPALLTGAAIVVAGLLVFNLLQWKRAAATAPPIHDISTDIVNPPEFNAILPLRKDAPNPAVYGGAEVAALQRRAYPDIVSKVAPFPPSEAFRQALAVAGKLGWKVVASDEASGRIEATDSTFWFGFRDDIVVRLSPVGTDRTVVDVRSVSRVGRGDAGTNAERIRKFFRELLPRSG